MAKVSDGEIVEAILSSPSISEAARRLGICRQALHKRLRRAELRGAVSDAERAQLLAVRAQVAAGFLDAVATVRALLLHNDPGIRLAAAGRMLSAAKMAGLDVAARADRDHGLLRAVRAGHFAETLAEQRDSQSGQFAGVVSAATDEELSDFAELAVEVAENATPADLAPLSLPGAHAGVDQRRQPGDGQRGATAPQGLGQTASGRR